MSEFRNSVELPATEHFDFLIDDYEQKIRALKKGHRTEKKETQLRSCEVQKIALEIARQSYLDNFAVSFENNQEEMDIRNVKTKAKVSGWFRTKKGAQTYLTITSYLRARLRKF